MHWLGWNPLRNLTDTAWGHVPPKELEVFVQLAPPFNANARLLKILKATPEQAALIDRVLAGEKPFPHHRTPSGPMLMGMGAAAQYLGVSRGTLWKIVRAGRLKSVEILPGSFRVCRLDLEKFVAKRACAPVKPVKTTDNGE